MLIKSIGLTFIMAFIWGTSFPMSKMAIDIIGPYAFRVSASLVSCVVVFLCFRKSIVATFSALNKSELLKLFITAVPNVFLVPTLNSIALHYTSVTNATILVYTMPSFTSLILMIDAGKINVISTVSLLFCLMGIMSILEDASVGAGELVIICSAFCWAIGAVLSQKVVSSLPFKVKLFWQIFIAALLVIITYPLFQSGELFLPLLHAFLNPYCLLSVLYLGTVGGAVVYFIWFYLIEHENAEYASYATLLSPIITVIIVAVFLNQMPSRRQIFGFVFILFSAVLVNILKPMLIKAKERQHP